jgi:hypothetical protein
MSPEQAKAFNWSVFSAGLLMGTGSYGWAVRAAGRAERKVVAAMLSADARR